MKAPCSATAGPRLSLVLCVSTASLEQRQAMAKPSPFRTNENHKSDGQAVTDRKQTSLAMLMTRLPVSDSVDLL